MTVHQHGRYGTSVDDLASRAVPDAVVGRLAVYLRVLTSMISQGVTTMSSEELAGAAGVNSATLRKDLSYVGSYGTRGVGYDTARLVEHIEHLLGLTRHHSVAVVGIGTSAMHWLTTAVSPIVASRSRRCSTSRRTSSASRSAGCPSITSTAFPWFALSERSPSE